MQCHWSRGSAHPYFYVIKNAIYLRCLKTAVGALALLLATHPAAAEPSTQVFTEPPVHIELSADRSTLGFGEILSFTLTFTATNSILPEWPAIDSTLGPFLVQDQTESGPFLLANERKRRQRAYSLLPQQTGNLSIPALTMGWQALPDGCPPVCPPAQTQRFDAISINITSVVPKGVELTRLQTIGIPLSLPAMPDDSETDDWIWPTLLAGSLLLLAWLWQRQRRRANALPTAMPNPASQALAELHALHRQLSLEDSTLFYQQLADILRRYLCVSRGLPALQRTRQEIRHTLNLAQMPPSSLTLLDQVLAACDQVKFAQAQHDTAHRQKTITQAQRFFELSTPTAGSHERSA